MISFVKVSPGQGGRFISLPSGLSQYTFGMVGNANKLFDFVTGVTASCVIPGNRWILATPPNINEATTGSDDIANPALWSVTGFNIVATGGVVTGKTFPVFRITEGVGNSWHGIVRTANSFAGIPDNYWVTTFGYVKAGNNATRLVRFSGTNKNGSFRTVDFLPATGTYLPHTYDDVYVKVCVIGDGWYCCQVAVNIGSGASNPERYLLVIQSAANRTPTYVGDGTSYFDAAHFSAFTSGTIGPVFINPMTMQPDGPQHMRIPANTPPVEDVGLRACPAFTQLAKYTEYLTNAAWTTLGITKTPDGTFQGMAIWNIAESTDPTTYHILSQNIGLSALPDNSVVGLSAVVKYSGRKIAITLQTKANTYISVQYNLQTGVIESNSAGAAASITPLGDGYYRVFYAYSLLTGGTTPLLYIQMALENSSIQYTGDGVSGMLIGQPTYINFGVNGIPFIPPYIPNNTGNNVSVVSETATATTGMSFDLDDAKLARLKAALRGPNAQGQLELEFVSNLDSGWLGVSTSTNIFYSATGFGFSVYVRKASDSRMSIRAYDGTNTPIVNINQFSSGQSFKIILDWGYLNGALKMRLTVNNVKSSLADFSGSFGSQDLSFFFGNTVHAGWIKNIKILPRPIW